ncbi:WGR domain-containing protein [Tumidithrix helvetica PCC 7403]|uniref:outer membrane protein assembly factor BamB family protein n=1 Tax=Tumidithrix helvetica TaxID=3457545 RepID=UPI003CA46C63
MHLILHRGGDRFVLQSAETGIIMGLMLQPIPGESINMFAYNFGSTYGRDRLQNVADFSELDYLEFFAIESLGFYDFNRYLHSPNYQTIHTLFAAEAKNLGYNDTLEKPAPNPLTPMWELTPPNPSGTWKVPAWGLWVNEQGCWLGNRDGLVVAIDRQGEIILQHKLPQAVRSLTGSDRLLYASCDDGQIYDLTGKLPQAVYSARGSHPPCNNFLLHALALHRDRLLILDAYGHLTCLDLNLNPIWQQQTAKLCGWFLDADDRAIYHGHSRGVTCYDWETGKIIWENTVEAPVLCGQLTDRELIVGTSGGKIYALEKVGDVKTRQTSIRTLATCDGAVYACARSRDRQALIAADYGANLYRFTSEGELQGKYPTGCGAILTMRLWDTSLYAVTTNGCLACFDRDFKREAIATQSFPMIESPMLSSPVPIKKSKQRIEKSSNLIPASPQTIEQGVIVECFKQGGKLKVRAISPDYHSDWNVQFPTKLRQESVRYRVEALEEAKQGGFYRVVGQIQPLEKT